MSVFTSRVTVTVPVPTDPDQTVTLQKLAPRHLDAAQKKSQADALASLRDMGGPAFLKEMAGLGDAEKKAATGQRDPLLAYDSVTLLVKGIKAWTYDAPLTAESFEDLDEETQTALAREVLKLSRPRLFQTAAEAETDQKNG